GSWPGCVMQMQIKTFDQTPTSQNPPGGCTASSCYKYPAALNVAPPGPTPTTVTVPLSSFSSWSATNAAAGVGLQWQWTYSDAGAGCPIDAAITDIKFLP